MNVLPQAQSTRHHAIQRCIEGSCNATYRLDERVYTCSRCGGLLAVELSDEQTHDPLKLRETWWARRVSTETRDRSGVWRYRELLPFTEDAPVISLAEGNTPLYDAPRSASYCGLDALNLKHQGCNPTGSFKDTGMTTAVTQSRILNARLLVCASTGNTAASLAAYAARADMLCAIVVPRGLVSRAKLAQSLDYGAIVLELEGNFDDSMRVIRELSEDESIYLVNSINPFRIEGQKTVAAELLEQLSWEVPDHVIVPGGNLGNSSAFGKGFQELFNLGIIERVPRLSVVQAEGAAPFSRLFARYDHNSLDDDKPVVIEMVDQPQTLASAIRIGAPISWQKAWRAVVQSKGWVLAVSEQEIADAKAIIGRDGIGCEPASATTVAGVRHLVSAGNIKETERVVAVLTGHLLKDTDYVTSYHSGTLVDPLERPLSGTFANQPLRVSANKNAVLEAIKSRSAQ